QASHPRRKLPQRPQLKRRHLKIRPQKLSKIKTKKPNWKKRRPKRKRFWTPKLVAMGRSRRVPRYVRPLEAPAISSAHGGPDLIAGDGEGGAVAVVALVASGLAGSSRIKQRL